MVFRISYLSYLLLVGDEHYVNHSGTSLRVGSVGRLVTPGSTCGYSFEGTGDSDDEGTELEMEEDASSYRNVSLILYFVFS